MIPFKSMEIVILSFWHNDWLVDVMTLILIVVVFYQRYLSYKRYHEFQQELHTMQKEKEWWQALYEQHISTASHAEITEFEPRENWRGGKSPGEIEPEKNRIHDPQGTG